MEGQGSGIHTRSTNRHGRLRKPLCLGLFVLGSLAVVAACQPVKPPQPPPSTPTPPVPPAPDTTAPAVTLTMPANGSSTNDDTPELSGAAGNATGDAATVTVRIHGGTDTSGVPVETLTPTRAGAVWSATAASLADGNYTAQATQADDNGNVGTSSANTFTIDTVAPAVPSIPDLDPSSDSGVDDDDVTNDATPILLGTAEAGATVTILADGVPVGSGTATGGNYSVTVSVLADGPHAITATATDTAGNTSAPSAALNVTIDTTAPVVTVTTPANGAVTNDDTPELSGAASDAATVTVTIYEGGDTTGTVVETLTPTAASGAWSATAAALADGTYTIEATQADVAGNLGTSTANTFTVDTTAPVAPSTPDLDASSDSGVDDDVTTDATPTFVGTAEAGATVTILADGVPVGSGVATGGNYSVTTSTLADGVHAITATATDAAGNVSTASSALNVTIDTVAPAVPSTPDLEAASDSGTLSSDDVTSVATPTFVGVAEAGATVTILADGVPVGSGVATGGNYSVTTSTLADGVHAITATATDTAGNVSAPSAALNVTIDTTAPVVTILTPADGAVTADDTPALSGTASDLGIVTLTIYAGADTTGTVVETLTPTAAGGAWSATAAALADGTYTIEATQADVAGNLGTSTANTFTVDTTAPTGTISGTVTDASSNPLTSIAVGVLDGSGNLVASVFTDSAGAYTVDVPVGTYKVAFQNTLSPTTHDAQAYDNQDSLALANDVEVTSGSTTSGIDAQLNPASATLSGIVVDGDNAPLAGVDVRVSNAFVEFPITIATTDSNGEYSSLIGAGLYKIQFVPSSGASCDQWYDGQADFASAAAVTIPVSDSFTANGQLDCATISGAITNGSTPLPGILVQLYDLAGNPIPGFSTVTDGGGMYSILVNPGDYKLEFNDVVGTCGSEWFDDAVDHASADIVTVTSGVGAVADAVFTCGSIAGTVTDATNPLPGVSVQIHNAGGGFVWSTTSDAAGAYEVRLAPGDYKVEFSPFFGATCGEWFNDQPDESSADPVNVAAGAIADADAVLDCGIIFGTITAGGAPFGPVNVFDTAETFVAGATPDSSGDYTAVVDPGDYKVRFGSGACIEWFDGQASFDDAATVDVIVGTPVNASADVDCGTVSGILDDGVFAKVGPSVEVYDTSENLVALGNAIFGRYELSVPAGTYRLQFGDGCTEWFDNQSSFATATDVVVTAGGTTTASAALDGDHCGTLAGTLTEDGTGNPAQEVVVQIYDTNGNLVDLTVSEVSGEYAIPLNPGSYKVQFADLVNGIYQSEWYDDTDEANADDVTITTDATTTADAQLALV